MSYVSKNPRFTTTSVTDSTTGTISSPPSGVDKIINRNGVLYLKNSAGGETPIGSSSGGKNYLAKQSDASAAVGTVSVVAASGNISVSGTFPNVSSAWYADAGAAAIAISSDNTLRGTSNYLTALTSFSAAGAVYVQTPAFNIDGEDLGKALAVQFDVAGNTTADDWDVVAVRYTSAGVFGALIPIAGIASTTTGTASAQVPTGTTTFRGFFITNSTASDVYSLRWRRRAGAVAIRFDNLIVGPNSVMLGTAITDWQSYTPTVGTISGYTTSPAGFYRRVGDSVEIYVKWQKNGSAGLGAAVVTVSIPSGLLIDTTKSGGTTNISLHGYAEFINAAYADLRSINYISTSTVAIGLAGSQMIGTDFAASSYVEMRFMAPIVGYSSNVTMADRAVEEYASNFSTNTTTQDLTSFVYGGAGNLIQNVTAGLTRRVRFISPILSTDKLTLQLAAQSSGPWLDSPGVSVNLNTPIFAHVVNQSASTTIGIGLRSVSGSTTDIDVSIGSGQLFYGASDFSWLSGGGSAYYWRVRKVSGGAAVGFPVGARNVIGDTTGTAVPAGYIGEVLSQSRLKSAAASLTTATPANVTATSLTLTPGVWLLSGTVGFRTAATTSVTALFGAISTTSATIPPSDTTAVPSSTGQIQLAQERAANVFGSGDNNVILPPNVVVVTTSTPYFLVAQASFTVSTMTTYGFISAVRIA